MASRRNVRWLLDELPELVSGGVLDPETADRIRAHYDASADRSATAIFAVLGSTFIGLGVVLLVAHNWDELSRFARAGLSMGLLGAAQAAGAFVLFRGSEPASPGAREGSAVLVLLGILASIALISQTYHFAGDLDGYLFTCLCLSLPLPYLFGSRLAASLCLAGAFWWLVLAKDASNPNAAWYFALFVAALAVFLWNSARSATASYRDHVLGAVAAFTIPLGALIALEFWEDRFAMPVVAAVASGVYALGVGSRQAGTPNAFAPAARLLGGLAIAGFGFALTYGDFWEEVVSGMSKASFRSEALISYGIAIAAAAWAGRVGVRSWSAGELSQAIFLAIAPVVLVAQELLFATDALPIPTLLLNAYVLALGLRTMVEGVRDGELRTANFGLLLVGALVIARFSDLHWSFTVRGLAFIALGVAFLLVNLRIRRREAST